MRESERARQRASQKGRERDRDRGRDKRKGTDMEAEINRDLGTTDIQAKRERYYNLYI